MSLIRIVGAVIVGVATPAVTLAFSNARDWEVYRRHWIASSLALLWCAIAATWLWLQLTYGAEDAQQEKPPKP